MPGMEAVNKVLAVLNKRAWPPAAAIPLRPVRGVEIFANIHPVRVNMMEQLLISGDLLLHGMAAVINQDVYLRNLHRQRFQEFAIGLVANEYFNLRLDQLPA